jgi:hypothetical protein
MKFRFGDCVNVSPPATKDYQPVSKSISSAILTAATEIAAVTNLE